MLVLTEVEALEFDNAISEAMFHYSYNPNGSDYVCGFCSMRPDSQTAPIQHSSGCAGKKMLDVLRGRIDAKCTPAECDGCKE